MSRELREGGKAGRTRMRGVRGAQRKERQMGQVADRRQTVKVIKKKTELQYLKQLGAFRQWDYLGYRAARSLKLELVDDVLKCERTGLRSRPFSLHTPSITSPSRPTSAFPQQLKSPGRKSRPSRALFKNHRLIHNQRPSQ